MRSLLTGKPIKIASITVGIAAVLAAAFFLAPGAGPTPGSGPAPSSTMPQSAPSTVSDGAELTFSLPDIYEGLVQALDEALAAGLETVLPQTGGITQAFGTTKTEVSGAATGTSAGRITTTRPMAPSTAPAQHAATSRTTVPSTAAVTTATRFTFTASTKASTSSSTATTTSASTSSSTTTTTTQRTNTVTISIRCDTAADNDRLRAGKAPYVPSNGIIMSTRTVTFTEGETVFNILQRETRAAGIHMEYTSNPMFNSVYIAGINNLYEFDCGELSGWMYRVNGWFPNYGCSAYTLKQGDVIEWLYTCDLGNDIGGGYAAGMQG